MSISLCENLITIHQEMYETFLYHHHHHPHHHHQHLSIRHVEHHIQDLY